MFMEEFSSEVEQEERGLLRTHPFTGAAVGVYSLGVSEREVLVFSAQRVWRTPWCLCPGVLPVCGGL